jgi:hypothetical protein
MPRYATVGLSLAANVAGPIFLTMFLYEMLYTGIGRSIPVDKSLLVSPIYRCLCTKPAFCRPAHPHHNCHFGYVLWCLGESWLVAP